MLHAVLSALASACIQGTVYSYREQSRIQHIHIMLTLYLKYFEDLV